MSRSTNLLRRMQRSFVCSMVLLASITGLSGMASAGQLPPVTGVSFDGSTISWQALDTATGYNIYRDFQYVDTVINGTEYVPDGVGEYRISAFDGNGNFSPLQVIDSEVVPTSNIATVEFFDDVLEPAQNVYGTVYSISAGEIFWDRNPSRNLDYTVSLNDVELGSTSGNSFWVNSLLTNASNRVAVTARDRDGSLSEPVTMLFETFLTQSFPVPAFDTVVDISDDEVASPQNAILEIYSSTTAELFWDRAPVEENVSITEIYRADELIGTSPGNSFYDDTRAPDILYTYELIAIDANGTRSSSTFINPGPFDNTDDDDDTDETLVLSLLQGISEVVNANPHVQWYPIIQSIRSGDVPDEIVEISSVDTFDEELEIAVTRTVYECDRGFITVEKTSEFASSAEILFDDCSTNRVLFSGNVLIFSRGDIYESVDYSDLYIAYDDTDLTMSGNVTSGTELDTGVRTITYDSFDYYMIGNLVDESNFDTSVVLDQIVSFDSENSSGPSTFTTSFSVFAPWTQGRTLNISTDNVFAADESSGGNYTFGSLSAESGNGDRLSLSADTGDSQTWYSEITDSSGTRGLVGQWSDLIQLPCIVLNDKCS